MKRHGEPKTQHLLSLLLRPEKKIIKMDYTDLNPMVSSNVTVIKFKNQTFNQFLVSIFDMRTEIRCQICIHVTVITLPNTPIPLFFIVNECTWELKREKEKRKIIFRL